MNRTSKAAVIALILTISFATPLAAGAIDDATAAYGRGDYVTAMRLLWPLANRGAATAQHDLGVIYEEGYGVKQDYAAAASWYRKAADQGYAAAQNNLGAMYDKGRGVPQDYATAAIWFRKAADQGDANAQSALGGMYSDGRGVPQDYAAAASWYRKAADQGDAQAQSNLGFIYATGQGVRRDDETAVGWFRRAADQGRAKAQSNLGLMYGKGQGVPQDYVSAHMWLSFAVDGGDKDAGANRDIIAASMTPAQLAEAQRRAAAGRPRMANAAPSQASPPPSESQNPVTARKCSECPTAAYVVPPAANPSPNPFDLMGVAGVSKLEHQPRPASRIGVQLKMEGGVFVIPIQINGTVTLDFVIDSGASDVGVPADVFSTLKRAGTIRESDFIGQNTYVLADGSKTESATFTIRSLRVGDTVVENVRGSIASSQAGLLLGLSFLERFKSWSIDNTTHELLLDPR